MCGHIVNIKIATLGSTAYVELSILRSRDTNASLKELNARLRHAVGDVSIAPELAAVCVLRPCKHLRYTSALSTGNSCVRSRQGVAQDSQEVGTAIPAAGAEFSSFP